MRTQKYNKLVRDNIAQLIAAESGVPVTETLGEEAFVRELKRKLLEECHELFEASTAEDKAEEIGDVLEVLHAMAETEKIGWETVEEVRLKKKEKRGAFQKKVFLKCVSRK